MSATPKANELGHALCVALGINDVEVVAVTLTMRAGDTPVAVIETAVWDQDMSEFVERVTEYELRPKGST